MNTRSAPKNAVPGIPIQSAPNGISTAQAAVMPPAATTMTMRLAPGVGNTNANSRPAEVAMCSRCTVPGSERVRSGPPR